MNFSKIISVEVINKQFLLLCLSAGLFMAGFNMIIPELPAYLTQLGGADYKGLIISLFAAMAAFSRPFSGKLADAIGRKPIMVFGALASALCCALYPFVATLFLFFALRLVHGLSTGFKPTGDTAFLADIVPAKNRGEALGLLGMSSSIGMAAGPAIGSLIAYHFGLNAMFAMASATSLASIAIVIGMQESIPTKKFRWEMLKINRSDIFEPLVTAPALVMVLTVYCFGMALTIIPDFSEHLGLKNKGLFFTVMLVFSIITRIFSGKASDRLGRSFMLKIGTAVLALSMPVIGFANSPLMFMIGAAIFGVATGINSPTVFAWTVDLADDNKRGRAMSTLYIALEIGILLGAIISAEIYNNKPDQLEYAFLTGFLLAGSAWLFLYLKQPKKLKIKG